MSAFNQGLMTGAQLGGRIYEKQQGRKIGGLMTSGDYAGAAGAAYQAGDLQTGQGIERLGDQRQDSERQSQITGALQTGDFEGAMSFASSPQEMQAIAQFRNTASEREVAEAAQKAGQMAAVLESVMSLPPEQQLAAAQQAAPMFGVDPATLTPDTLRALPGLRVQAMGLKDYLSFQQRERDATRPIVTPFGIMMPPGVIPPGMPQQGGGNEEVLSALPQGARIRPRPNQASFASAGDAETALKSTIGDVFNVTSAQRTPERNRQVGGSPNSRHLRGRALDLVPKLGETMDQLEARVRRSGIQFRELINEGDHIHVAW